MDIDPEKSIFLGNEQLAWPELNLPSASLHLDVNGAGVSNSSGLFDAVAAAAQFPSYFGRNWDALDDCLNDMEWLPAPGYVFRWTNASDLLRGDADAFFQFLHSFARAAWQWKYRGVPFVLVIVDDDIYNHLGRVIQSAIVL